MKKLNKDINIFVSCHKNFYVPENKYLIPVQVGSTNSKTKFDMQKDDGGENISHLNPYYCELTAQYWAWKNVDCQYYGFFHYRRYLSFNKIDKIDFENITDEVLNKIGLNEAQMQKTINEYDIIMPTICDLSYERKEWNNVYNQYKNSPEHNIEDLDLTINIIHNLYPEFDKYVNKVLKGHKTYFLNMYIMKKEYFFKYCEWLFPILEQLHKAKDYSHTSLYEARTIGLVAERLATVFIEYLKDKNPKLKIKELQNTFFQDCENPYLLPKLENKIGICFASDTNYAKHLGVALTSLVETSSPENKYDIIIFDNKMSLKDRSYISGIVANKDNFSLRFLKTFDYIDNKNLAEKTHINKSTYLRFAILDLLRNYKEVIYLDCDIVLNHDIADMYKIPLDNNYVAACLDSTMSAWNNAKTEQGKGQRWYNSNVIGMKDVYQYFCAGIMIFNVEVMKNKITTEQLFKIALETNYAYQDQDVLNKVCYGHVKFLPMKWNYMAFHDIDMTAHIAFPAPREVYLDYVNAKNNPYIIHYAGHFQPMYVSDVHCGDIFWKNARKSPYYEELLWDLYKTQIPAQTLTRQTFKSKVKQKLKKMFPADTRRGRFLRKIYRKIKK